MKNSFFAQAIISLFCLTFLFACSAKDYSPSRAEILYGKGQQLLSKGEGEAAIKMFRQSLELSRKDGFQAGIAHNLNEIAIYHTAGREYIKARELLVEALAIYRQEEMAPEVSKAINNISLTYIQEGDWQTAMKRYEELLAWDRRTKNRLGEGITLYNIGLVNGKWLGRQKIANKQFSAALEIFRKLKATKYIQAVEKAMKDLKLSD